MLYATPDAPETFSPEDLLPQETAKERILDAEINCARYKLRANHAASAKA